jgi:hypothetical protein
VKALFFITLLTTSNFVHAQEVIENFNKKLEQVFDQKTNQTMAQQLVYTTIEAASAYSLNLFISKKNQDQIKAITQKISDVNTSTALTEEQKLIELISLKKELYQIQGSLIKRTANKTIKFLVRGTQVLLLFDIGARLYVMQILNNSDPGLSPTQEIFCDEFSCGEGSYEFVDSL